MNDNKIGRNIRRRRELIGMEQQELAAKIRITGTAVCKIEKGVRIPKLSTLIDIARVLGCKPEELLEEVS